MSIVSQNIKTIFERYFEIVHANNDDLRNEVFKLRYQVYVIETGFEKAEDHPSGLERDIYDTRSDFYLLRHLHSGLYAGTVRLILPHPNDINEPFPIERHCTIFPHWAVTDPLQRAQLGEVSRFAVSKEFKRRLGESNSTTGITNQSQKGMANADDRRILPHLSIALFALWTRLMHQHGLIYCYAVMEPSLHRLIARYGLNFHIIGHPVDYHGQRIPCLGNMLEILPNVKQLSPPLWDFMTDNGTYTCGSHD